MRKRCFLFNRKSAGFPVKQEALRAGTHCGKEEYSCLAARSQAENPFGLKGRAMLELKKKASAGAEESGDIMVAVEPGEQPGIVIDLESNVKEIFGEAIRQTICEVLEQFHVNSARVTARDKGALDFAVRARTMCAVCRAAEITYDWRGEDEKN